MAERGNGKQGGPLIDEESGTQNQASHHPPASEEQAGEGDDGTGKQRKDKPDGIE